MKAIFATFVILLLSVGFASACPACPEGTIQIDVPTPAAYQGLGMDNIGVVGYQCNYYWPNQITTNVQIPEAGTYDVKGYVLRGSTPPQCQGMEEFFLTVGGVDGPVSEDDANCWARTERLDFLGTFEFDEGSNAVTMTSATTCPPAHSANSVEIERLCIAPVPPSAPEFPTPLLALAVFAITPGIAYIAKKR